MKKKWRFGCLVLSFMTFCSCFFPTSKTRMPCDENTFFFLHKSWSIGRVFVIFFCCCCFRFFFCSCFCGACGTMAILCSVVFFLLPLFVSCFNYSRGLIFLLPLGPFFFLGSFCTLYWFTAHLLLCSVDSLQCALQLLLIIIIITRGTRTLIMCHLLYSIVCTSSSFGSSFCRRISRLDERTMTMGRQEDDCDKSDMRSLRCVHFSSVSFVCLCAGVGTEKAICPHYDFQIRRGWRDEGEGREDLSSLDWQTVLSFFFFVRSCRRPDFMRHVHYQRSVVDGDEIRGSGGEWWWRFVASGHCPSIWLTLGDHFIRSMMRERELVWAGWTSGEL